jgi:hypothetical protein
MAGDGSIHGPGFELSKERPMNSTTIRPIRLFLIVQGISFAVAALIHSGAVIDGYQHEGAARAESIIAAELLAGLGLTWIWPPLTRVIAIAVQAFALALTYIGTYVSIIGVGPHTVPDIVFHVGILLVLMWGLVVAARDPRSTEGLRLTAMAVVQPLIRATGLLQLVIGLAMWAGMLLVAVPFHIFTGLFFVLLLEVQAGLAAWTGAARGLAALTVVWGVFVALLGWNQTQILPGDWHWLVRVAHLVVGLVAMGLAEQLVRTARRDVARGRPTSIERPSIERAA